MPSSVVGGAALRKAALNWSPCVRSLTQEPLAWTNSPAVIEAAAPTTVTSSRCPRTLTRSTQKPFSGLWKVTRSTSPASASRSGAADSLAPPWIAPVGALRLARSAPGARESGGEAEISTSVMPSGDGRPAGAPQARQAGEGQAPAFLRRRPAPGASGPGPRARSQSPMLGRGGRPSSGRKASGTGGIGTRIGARGCKLVKSRSTAPSPWAAPHAGHSAVR